MPVYEVELEDGSVYEVETEAPAAPPTPLPSAGDLIGGLGRASTQALFKAATFNPVTAIPTAVNRLTTAAARVPQPVYDVGLPVAGSLMAGLPGAAGGGALAKAVSLARQSTGAPITGRSALRTVGEIGLAGAGTAGMMALGGGIARGVELPLKGMLSRALPAVGQRAGRFAASAAGGAAAGAAISPEGTRTSGALLGGLTGGAGQGIAEVARPAGRFITGERTRIRKAQEQVTTTIPSELERVSDQTVKAFRRGGRLHGKFFAYLEDQGDKLWEPVRRLGRNLDVQAPITLDEVNLKIASDFPEDQMMANNLRQFFAATIKPDPQMGGTPVITGSQLLDEGTRIGQKIRQAAHQGRIDRTMSDQTYANARSIIADMVEERAPAHLKGVFGEAKSAWTDHATDRKEWFKKLHPGASPHLPRGDGSNYLQKAVTSKFPTDELERLQRLQVALGEDFMAPVRQVGQRLSKAQQDLTRAEWRGRVGLGTGGVIGGATLLRLLGMIGERGGNN